MKLSRKSSPEWLRAIMGEFMKPPQFVDKMYQAWQPDNVNGTDGQGRGQAQEGVRYEVPRGQSSDGSVVPASISQVETRSATGSDWRTLFRDAGIPQQVATRYGWNVERAERYGRVLKVDTGGRKFAVKQSDLSADRIQFIHESLQYAEKQGFGQFAPLILTDEGSPSVSLRGKSCYASQWLDGQPVNFGNNRHVGKVAQALARFHERTRGFQAQRSSAPPAQFNLKRLLRHRANDLNTLLVEAERRPLPGRFEQLLKMMGDSLRSDAEASVKAINDSACATFLSNERKRPGLCHLDVIPGNFVMDPSGRVYLIDFDLMTFAPRALDLSHLLRRCLQLQNWDTEAAYVIFLQYNAIQTMTAAEYEVVHALLRFPYKAWRVIHTRYRQFEEPEQVRLLELYRDQDSRRQAFLESFKKQIIR